MAKDLSSGSDFEIMLNSRLMLALMAGLICIQTSCNSEDETAISPTARYLPIDGGPEFWLTELQPPCGPDGTVYGGAILFVLECGEADGLYNVRASYFSFSIPVDLNSIDETWNSRGFDYRITSMSEVFDDESEQPRDRVWTIQKERIVDEVVVAAGTYLYSEERGLVLVSQYDESEDGPVLIPPSNTFVCIDQCFRFE